MDDVGSLGLDAETPEEQRQLACRLIAWADEPAPADPGAATAAELLVEAGQILEILGDHSGAVAAYRRAAAEVGASRPDPRGFLHRALVSVGDLPAARLLAEEIRRSAPADVDVYAMVGEAYEKHGDLREAHRWLNLGVRQLSRLPMPGTENMAFELLLLSIVRRRIRRALGLPADGLDRLAGLREPRGQCLDG